MAASVRRIPFPERRNGRAFNAKFQQGVNELLRGAVDEIIPPENQQSISHGRGWTQARADGTQMTQTVEAHTAETLLPFEDIVSARVRVLPEQMMSIRDQMATAFMETLLTRVSEAVEQVGNVVSAKDKPPTQTYLDLLNKIEFGVDRNGNVTHPELFHGDPAAIARFSEALERARTPEFDAEVATITEAKTAQALKREEERLAKFKQHPPEE